MATPTVISGQHDTGEVVDGVAPTGAITEGTLTTPAVSFETVALGLPVFVDAILTQVTDGAGTGVIDSDGKMQFRTSMAVRLEIFVPSANLRAVCETSPVELVLDSTTQYDPDGAKRVTLRDQDFSVPPVPVTDDCFSLVADNVNELLAGGGHSLTMTFGGELVLPPKADCPTMTELVMDPVDEVRFGTEVTLTGTAARDPAGIGTEDCEGVEEDAIPSGLIEFRDGNRVLGTGEVDPLTGVATFTTDDLPAGDLDLVAAYRSSPPFAASASEVTPYRVTADPAVTVDLPDFLQIGAAPTEFDVTVTNSPLGSDIANGRMTLTVAAPSNSVLNMTVEYQEDDGTWTPVPVTLFGTNVFARIDPLVGRAIDAGEEVTRRVRVAAPAPTTAGPYEFIVELVQVDPVTGDPAPQLGQTGDIPTPGLLGTARGEVPVLGVTRLTPTWSMAAVQPHTLRQGQTVRLNNVRPIPTTIGSIFPTGPVRVLFDGQLVPVRLDTTPVSFGYLPFLDRQTSNNISPEFVVPVDAPLGDRTVTVVYEGDRFFAPAQLSTTVRVLAARGPTYTCASSLLAADRFTVNVEASAIVPTAGHPGDEVDLGGLDISFLADRGGSVSTFSGLLAATNLVGVPSGVVTVQAIDMELAGGQGTGTAGAFTTANKTLMTDATRPQDPAPDAVYGFNDETASVTLQGAPGDEIPITLDRVRVTGVAFAASVLDFDCVPLGDPVSLGTVKLAGAALTVDAPQPARVGDTVTLTTQVHPIGSPGLVEFFDGTTSLGLVAVDSLGLASLQTDELDQGTRELSARFFGGLASLSSTTEIVVLEVLVETECAAFAEEGNGAIVRLVYMELLGRCPDESGYDYWVGRLDGGLSVDSFARIIARTAEATGMVVDDAYQTMLGRAPDAPGRAFWTGRLQGHGRYDTLLADLGASPEFWTKAGSSNTGFVTRVYEQLLDRVPDQAGQDYWVGRLDAGTSPRALILSLANLDEPLGVLVADSYDEILSRNPSAGERTSGIAFLRRTGDRSGLYAQLIGTQEFATRAGTFPNPED